MSRHIVDKIKSTIMLLEVCKRDNKRKRSHSAVHLHRLAEMITEIRNHKNWSMYVEMTNLNAVPDAAGFTFMVRRLQEIDLDIIKTLADHLSKKEDLGND